MWRLLFRFVSRTFLLPVTVAFVSLKLVERFVDQGGLGRLERGEGVAERGEEGEEDLIVVEEAESVIWLNVIFAKLWRRWSRGFEDDLLEQIHPFVVQFQPKLLPKLVIGKFSMGDDPPRIISAKTFRTYSDTNIIFDANIEWTSPDFEISIKPTLTSTSELLTANNFVIKARLRIALDLKDESLGVERIRVSVIGKPLLKVSIVPLSTNVDILSNSKLEEWFSALTRFLIEGLFAFPNALSFQFKEGGVDVDVADGGKAKEEVRLDVIDEKYSDTEVFNALFEMVDSSRRIDKERLDYRSLLRREVMASAPQGAVGFLLVKVIEGVHLGVNKRLDSFTPTIQLRIGQEVRSTKEDREAKSKDLFFNERLYLPVIHPDSDLLHVQLTAERSDFSDIIHRSLIIGSAWISIQEIREANGRMFSWLRFSDVSGGDPHSEVGSVRLQLEYREFGAKPDVDTGSGSHVQDCAKGDVKDEGEHHDRVIGHWKVLLLELTRWTGKKTIQDMWCEVECGEHEYSTKVVRWNRQPTWNELLCFPVTDPGTEILRFIIIDDEILRDDMIVGRVTLALTGLGSVASQELWLPLILSNDETRNGNKCWLRVWVSYESAIASDPNDPDDNSFIVNPSDLDMGNRAELMRRKFLKRMKSAEQMNDTVLLKALGKLDANFMMHLSASTAPALLRMGRDAIVERVKNVGGSLRKKNEPLHGLTDALKEVKIGQESGVETVEAVKVPLLLTFITGSKHGAGTDGNVWVIFCKAERRSSVELLDRRKQSFQRSRKDVFCVVITEDLTPPDRIVVGHENSGLLGVCD